MIDRLSAPADLGVLGDVSGLNVIELGCGGAYLSAWLTRRGAQPVEVNLTSARHLAGQHQPGPLGAQPPGR